MSRSKVSIHAFDLFCSVGGLTYGLQKSGIQVLGGIDIDPSCQYAYEHNCKATFLTKDIRNLCYQDISSFLGNADCRVIAGCAPCQPFSTHVSKIKERRSDTRWNLIKEMARIIKEGLPEIVSMENVPNLEREVVFHEFVTMLRKSGYFVAYDVAKCLLFGVPQNRKRLILLASRLGPIALPKGNGNTMKNVRDTIGHLPGIGHGDTCPSDPLHTASGLIPVNIKRIKASVPGGSWKGWPKSLLPDCYNRESGQTYRSVYGRMEWDKPAPVLTTQFYRYGTGRYGHPEQNRALSLREGALLQTFPEDYEFQPPHEAITFVNTGRHIGNAVPPVLAQAIGNAIRKHVEEQYGQI